MTTHYSDYNFGDLVYLKTDPEQAVRIVTSITLRPYGVVYELGCSNTSSDHYGIEMTSEPNESFRLGVKGANKSNT